MKLWWIFQIKHTNSHIPSLNRDSISLCEDEERQWYMISVSHSVIEYLLGAKYMLGVGTQHYC